MTGKDRTPLIDAHTHIKFKGGESKWFHDWYIKYHTTGFGRLAGSSGKAPDEKEIIKLIESSYDPTGDVMVANMDKFGIDKSLVCVADLGLQDEGVDGPEMSIEQINEKNCEIVRRHPGRLFLAMGVDPRRKNAVEMVERGVKEWGAVAVKLFPPAGWYPNDRVAYPLYGKCVELGVPVDFHTGSVAGQSRGKFSLPIYYDDVAVDFPDLTIQCTHTGYYSFMDMLSIARARPNIVCDLAGWSNWTQTTQPKLFYRVLRFMMDMIGPGRVMFASDTAALKDDPRLAVWVKAVREIPDKAQEYGVSFTERELADFYSGTAMRVLKI